MAEVYEFASVARQPAELVAPQMGLVEVVVIPQTAKAEHVIKMMGRLKSDDEPQGT